MKKLFIFLAVFIVLGGCSDINKFQNVESITAEDGEDCGIQNFNPNADCKITRYLEQETLKGFRSGGVNFCSYTLFNENPYENPLYFLASCAEYFPAEYGLKCESEEALSGCPFKENIDLEEYQYEKEELKEYCGDSCEYVKLFKPVLNTSTAYAAVPMKITINEDGTMTHWEAADGRDHLSSIKNAYPEEIFQKYLSNEYDHRKDLLRINASRAKEHFGLDLGDDIKNSWWMEEDDL